MVTSVSTLLDAARGDLVLRILGTARHGQVVRIRSPKCTIGAGRHCTVRLRARGLFPLHCLILRGTETTIVRRWAPDTLLNGQTFTDAVLVPGDRLSIGRIQLEVLASEPAELRPAAPSRLPNVTLPIRREVAPPTATFKARLTQVRQQGRQRVRRLLEQLRVVRQQLGESQEAQTRLSQTEARSRSNLVDRERQVEQLTKQLKARESELTGQVEQLRSDLAKLESQRQEWQRQHSQRSSEKSRHEERSRQHIAELEAEQKKLQAECESLRRKQAEWELASAESYTSHQEQAQELERQKAALQTETETLEKARQRWEAEQAEARGHADKQAAELAARQAELEAAVEAFEQQQRQWQAEAESRQRAEKQAAELTARQAELQSAVEAFEQQRLQWQAEQERWEKQRREDEATLAEHREDLACQAEELEARCKALEQERERWEEEWVEASQHRERAEAAAAESRRLEGEAKSVSLDSLDLFRRLGTAPDWAEESEAAPAASERPVVSAPPPVNAPTPSTEEHEDDSVDAYMARLLQRVRGEAPSSAPETEPERSPVPTVASPVVPDPQSPSPASAHIKPATPVSLAPRAVAPERSVDLMAMRELANFSAQVALGQHAHGQMARERRMKLAVVGVALVTGSLLLWCWWFRSAPMVILHGANLSFLIALIWGVQYAVLTGHMIINRAGHLKWVSEPAPVEEVAAEALPEDQLPGLPAINEMLAQYHAQGAETQDEESPPAES